MRHAARASALAAILVVLAAGPGVSQTAPPPDAPALSDQLVSPSDHSSRSMTSVAEAPLSDLNLMRQKIPPILLAAIDDPYAPIDRLTCETLTAEIGRLYEALGRDFDDPPPPSDPNMTRPSGTGLKLIHSGVQSLIPYDGFVRLLSGAQKHDQLVMNAINAGAARRAYLKGLGESRNCPAPASPQGHGRDAVASTQDW